MSKPRGRRAAARQPSRVARTRARLPAPRRFGWVLCGGLLAVGVVALGLALAGIGPAWLDGVGAVASATAYSALLANRTGGRPLVFGALALACGIAVVVSDVAALRSGAAVMVTVIAAVLAVLATKPAVRFHHAVLETLVATSTAILGALAAVGFRPDLDVARFGYLTIFLSFALAFVLVYRLGAGLHGLGRRGLVLIVVGTLLLALALAYGELLRRYGTPGLVQTVVDAFVWMDEHLGAAPQALMSVLGIPALIWGVHQRARRRQGWWACAYGVAATARPAYLLVRPDVSPVEALLAVAYSVVVGIVLGFLVVRVDLFVTGSGGGRRSVRAEEALAVRPEPSRTRPLL